MVVLNEFKQILVTWSISIAWSAWIHIMLGVKVGHNLLSNIFRVFLLSHNVSLLSEIYFYLFTCLLFIYIECFLSSCMLCHFKPWMFDSHLYWNHATTSYQVGFIGKDVVAWFQYKCESKLCYTHHFSYQNTEQGIISHLYIPGIAVHERCYIAHCF